MSVVNAHKIARDRNKSKITTMPERKYYQIVFDKRVIGANYVFFLMDTNVVGSIFMLKSKCLSNCMCRK